MKVMDPEFCVYGPPGLDIGCLLAGYVLASVHHKHSCVPRSQEDLQSIRSAVRLVWQKYVDTMEEEGGFTAELMDKVGVETVGFSMLDTCRTALGSAGVRVWLQFQDEDVKKKAVKECMKGRHRGGIELLFREIDGPAGGGGHHGIGGA